MLTRRRFCLLPAFVLPPLSANAGRNLLRLAYAEDYSPYSALDDGRPAGIEVDVADEIFGKRLGFEVQHAILPWARAQLMVESGAADAMFAVPTPQRLAYTQASAQPLVRWRVSMFVRRGDRRLDAVRGIQDLAAFRIAVQRGNSWARSKLSGLQVEYVPSQTALPRMLIAGRFDVVLEDSRVMANILRTESGRAQINELPLSLDSADIHFLLGRRSPYRDLSKQFDTELKRMREDGSLSRLLDKYR